METLNYVMLCVNLFWRELAVSGAVMVSLIIAVIGFIKPWIKRIPNEELRKSTLAFSSVLLSFVATAVYFGIIRPDTNWDFYWIASLITSAACILTYWLYEYIPFVRAGVHKLLHFVINKAAHILNMIVDGKNSKEINSEIKKAKNELEETLKNEVKSVSKKSNKNDDEWKNL